MDPITQLPKPINGRPDVLIIAGEHSGDEHAATMVKELLDTYSWAKVCAFGGPKMEAAGAQLILNMVDHSVVGLVEVLKNYFFFRNLMRRTIAWITLYRPRVVCFVDYPGFNLRVADQLYRQRIAKQNGGDVTLLYYISPQIWAWKAKRRFKMADLLDGLAVIFPFEVDCYRDTQLPVRFVGHPFMNAEHVMPVRYDKKGPILLLPGSRGQPVSRIFPVMAKAWALAAPQLPKDEALVLYPSEKIRLILEKILEEIPEAKKRLSLRKIDECTPAKAVLTSSGTMSLCCALAGIPGAIAYRAHPLTFEIGRRIVKLKHLGIANILLNEGNVYHEYLQDDASPEKLANALMELVFDQSSRAKAFKNATRLMDILEDKVESTPARWLADNLGASFSSAHSQARPTRNVRTLEATPPPFDQPEQATHEIKLPPIKPIQDIPVYTEDKATRPLGDTPLATTTSPAKSGETTSGAPLLQEEGKSAETIPSPVTNEGTFVTVPPSLTADPLAAPAVVNTVQVVATPKATPSTERLPQPPHLFTVRLRMPIYCDSIDPLCSTGTVFYPRTIKTPGPVQPFCHTTMPSLYK